MRPPLTWEDALRLLQQADPLFETMHAELRTDWRTDDTPKTVLLSGYARRFAARCMEGDHSLTSRVLSIVETCLKDGDEVVKDAVATGFLEALLAQSSAGVLDFKRLDRDVGPLSRQYCISWDEYSGHRTPGLARP